MSAPHAIPLDLQLVGADWLIPDPGNGGSINHALFGEGMCELVSTGAETRTLPAPVIANQKLTLVLKTDGGDVTVTVKDTAGNTSSTHVFNDHGDFVRYLAVNVNGVLTWKPATYSGLGAALTAADASAIDTTYGQQEADVLGNLRTRVNEIEAVLEAAGLVKPN